MTPAEIAELAKCYACMDETQKRAAIVYLLDQLVSLGGGAESDTSLTITGTAGAGFIQLPSQSSNPSCPTTGFRLFADATGRFSWRRASDCFVRTWDATLSGDRVYTLKDASGTVPLLEVANTWSLAQTFTSGIVLGASGTLVGGTQIVEQRNAANPQMFRVYNTFTDATTYERGMFEWGANVLYYGSDKGSVGGSARDVQIRHGGTTKITIAAGSVTFANDVSVTGNFSSGGFVDVPSTGTLRFLTRTRMLSPSDGVLTLYNNASGDFGRLQFGGTANTFPSLKRSTTTIQARLADDTAFTLLEASQIKTNNGTFLVSGTALTNGAAGNTGTLTNSPATGNPTKWIPIDDNGTTRYIPCW